MRVRQVWFGFDSGNEKDKILDALMNLEAGGSTAGAEGIKLAYDVAKKTLLSQATIVLFWQRTEILMLV